MLVYLNGQYIDHSEARVPVDDRGFVFADGIYEVIRIYDGRMFLAEPHYGRLRQGLAALRIDSAAPEALPVIANRLISENGLQDEDAILYIQITRGSAPRKHAFPPAGTPATVFVSAKPFPRFPDEMYDAGQAAVTAPDTRWSRCDIKSISLLPNVLANQQAREAGAFEALFVRDGVLIEGSHSNLLAVMDGEVVTYPECNYVLGGITRRFVLDLARGLDIPVREGPILMDRLDEVDELFLSGTTTEVMPISRLDGRPIGDGTAGPIARSLGKAYREATRSTAAATL
jgi:D-alanine transaminase